MVEWLIYTSFSVFLLEQVKRKVSLKHMIKEYEKFGNKPLSSVAYWKHANRLIKRKKLGFERHEQLFLLPSMDSLNINHSNHRTTIEKVNIENRPLAHENIDKPIHSTHRILLSISYEGIQPLNGASYTKPFGRYGSAIQSIYKKDNMTITAFKRKLNIWIHNPKGIRTKEQLLNAKVNGYFRLKEFAKAHNLVLDGYLEKVLLSHHVVENENLNKTLKPLFEKYGDEIEDKLGSVIETASHPNKIQHQGKAREDRIINWDKIASGLEWLTLDFEGQFNKFSEEALQPLTEQIKLHLEVQRETLKTLKAIQKSLERYNP